MFARLVFCLLLLASSIFAIQCENDNSVIGQNRLQNRHHGHCSQIVFQCLKFECALPGEDAIIQGNPTVRKNCKDQGGTPTTCNKCNTDFCNDSATLSGISLIFTAVLSFLTLV